MRHLVRLCALVILLSCTSTAQAQSVKRDAPVRKEDPFIAVHVAFCTTSKGAYELAQDMVLVLTQAQPRDPHEFYLHLNTLTKAHRCELPPHFSGAFYEWDIHREHTRMVQLPGFRAGVRSLSRQMREGTQTIPRHAAIVAVPLEIALQGERIRGAQQMLEFFRQQGRGSFPSQTSRRKERLDI